MLSAITLNSTVNIKNYTVAKYAPVIGTFPAFNPLESIYEFLPKQKGECAHFSKTGKKQKQIVRAQDRPPHWLKPITEVLLMYEVGPQGVQEEGSPVSSNQAFDEHEVQTSYAQSDKAGDGYYLEMPKSCL